MDDLRARGKLGRKQCVLVGKSLLVGSVYLPNTFLMLPSLSGESDELLDQQIDIQTLYMLAKIAEAHVREQRVIFIRVSNGDRRPTKFQCAHHVVEAGRDNNVGQGDLPHHVMKRKYRLNSEPFRRYSSSFGRHGSHQELHGMLIGRISGQYPNVMSAI